MSGKYVILTFFFCSTPLILLFQSASAAELSDVKASALKKLESQKKIIDDFAFNFNFPNEQHRVQTVMDTRIDYGNVLSERTHFELGQVAASYRLIASLMKASEDVIKCMKDRAEEAQQENERFLLDRFHRPVREIQSRLWNAIYDRMFAWIDEKHDLYNEYSKLYEEAVNKIKNTENPRELSAILDSVMPKGEIFIKAAKAAVMDVNKSELEMLTFGDNKLNFLRQSVRQKLDKTKEAIENCFLVKSAYYNLKDILDELM